MAKYSPNFLNTIKPDIQKVQCTPRRKYMKKITPNHKQISKKQ